MKITCVPGEHYPSFTLENVPRWFLQKLLIGAMLQEQSMGNWTDYQYLAQLLSLTTFVYGNTEAAETELEVKP